MSSLPPPPATREPAPERAGQDGSATSPHWRLWMAPAAVLLGLGVGEVAVVVVAIVAHATSGSSLTHPPPAVNIIGDIVVDLAFVAAALYFASVQGGARARDFGYRRVGFRRGFGVAVAAGVSYYALTWVYAALVSLHGKDKLPSELGITHSTAALVAAAAFVCVIAPVAEEFFFRGFLFSVLRRWRIVVFGRDIGTWVAAAVVGLLFGLAHTGSASPQYLIPLGFLGFVLCLVRWRTGSLYPCMALHSFNNSLALGYNELHWSAGGIAALIVGSLMIIALMTGPLAFSRRRTTAA